MYNIIGKKAVNLLVYGLLAWESHFGWNELFTFASTTPKNQYTHFPLIWLFPFTYHAAIFRRRHAFDLLELADERSDMIVT